MEKLIKPIILLAIVALFLLESVLNRQSEVFQKFEFAIFALQWTPLFCLAVWCGAFFFLTYGLQDLPLIGLLLVAMAAYFMATRLATDSIMLLLGVTLGKGTSFALKGGRQKVKNENGYKLRVANSELQMFLLGLICFLTIASWWNLDMPGPYHGPRWMGLWNNPNDYGLLMAVGVTLAIGLLVRNLKSEKLKAEIERPTQAESADGADGRRFFHVFNPRKSAKSADREQCQGLLTSSPTCYSFDCSGDDGGGVGDELQPGGMDSHGHWFTLFGDGLWRKSNGGIRSSFCFPPLFLPLLFGGWFFWNTPRTAPWYFQRLDLSRGSVQHRIAAWKAGFEMMRDHPFGVGWNRTVGNLRRVILHQKVARQPL